MDARQLLRTVTLRAATGIFLASLVAGTLAMTLRPVAIKASSAPDLNAAVPLTIDEWHDQPSNVVQADLTVADPEDRVNTRPYDQTVMRNYVNSSGDLVMLAIAYAAEQEQEIKVHRPDVCYPAQGYDVLSFKTATLPVTRPGGAPVEGVQMLVRKGQRLEAVVYWLRTGTVYSQRSWDARMHIFKEGLHGRRPDGILVRASRIINNPSEANQTYQDLGVFLAKLHSSTAAPAELTLVR